MPRSAHRSAGYWDSGKHRSYNSVKDKPGERVKDVLNLLKHREPFLHILRRTFLTMSMTQGPGSECHSSWFPVFKNKKLQMLDSDLCFCAFILRIRLIYKNIWKAWRALTITLPPQMYPLHPSVALAWAALGAGARPCTQNLSLENHLRIFEIVLTDFQSS